jgi:sodium transport system ATP-binding protein
MIEIDCVHKSFPAKTWRGKSTPALSGMSLRAEDGQATGLVGANGAGKTTLFKICAGLLRPDAGRVLVGGVDPFEEPGRARKIVSLLPEKPGLIPDWTGGDHLEAAAALRGLSRAEGKRRADEAVEAFGLEAFLGREAGGYSRGQAVRVALAREHIADARVLILDEPTVGLDFDSAGRVRRWARRMAAEGRCVLIATHIVSEIEAMCDVIVGLRDGVAHDEATARGWIETARSSLEPSSSGPAVDFRATASDGAAAAQEGGPR